MSDKDVLIDLLLAGLLWVTGQSARSESLARQRTRPVRRYGFMTRLVLLLLGGGLTALSFVLGKLCLTAVRALPAPFDAVSFVICGSAALLFCLVIGVPALYLFIAGVALLAQGLRGHSL